jgi:hypothetical protein
MAGWDAPFSDLEAAARSRAAQKTPVKWEESEWITPAHLLDGSESARWDAIPLDKGCRLSRRCLDCPRPVPC